MINENEELMPVPADRAVVAFEQCERFAPETKPIVDEVDRSNARVVREILSQTPNAVNIANSYALANTYKAVGDVALQKMSDGTYSAVLRDSNGRVLEHVKMQKATPEFATAASFGYSALNAVVGQANMMSIAESLRAIEKELEESKDRDYIQVQGKIDSACRGLSADLAQVEDGQKKPTAVILLNSLREGLMTLKGYIDEEITG